MKFLIWLITISLTIMFIAFDLVISWFIVCALAYIFCLIFGLTFSVPAATFIWLIVSAIRYAVKFVIRLLD